MKKWLFSLGILLLCGCSTWRMIVTLRGDSEINQGRPLQVLIRSVSNDTYRSEAYTTVARLVIQPDKSVIRLITIEPRDRYKRRLFLSVPDDMPLALYFFYGSQTGSWRMLLPPPLPFTVSIPLGRYGVRADDVRECRLGRGP